MSTFVVRARNKTVPADQSLTFEYGYQDPWTSVKVEAETREAAIEKAKKTEKLLPSRLYDGHYIPD